MSADSFPNGSTSRLGAALNPTLYRKNDTQQAPPSPNEPTAPLPRPSFTRNQHRTAIDKCKILIQSYADFPDTEAQRKALTNPMFGSTPPRDLLLGERGGYVRQLSILVTALNAPAGTSRGVDSDKASRARKRLWGYWFTSRERRDAQVAVGMEAEEEDEEENDEEEKEEIMTG